MCPTGLYKVTMLDGYSWGAYVHQQNLHAAYVGQLFTSLDV